ncbi:MAG: hypothetical protein JOZ24_05240 [Candidatus Eremiobacteraeota bacterium]|nr:hypothetical protein [Candidatus Eremiobacteraeota bacterium]
MRYRCVAADCPLPEETYDTKLRRPPACRLGHCRVEPVDAAGSAPKRPREVLPGEAIWRPELRRPRSTAVLIAGGRRFVLPHECVLGRRGDVAQEAFAGEPTVSSEHARLTVYTDFAYIKNVSNGGHALVVNGASLAFGDEANIKLGRSRVRFGATFSCEIELME